MTNNDIIRIAFEHTVGGLEFDEKGLLRFVNLITAAEREACIRDCDSVDLAGADDCIAAIRARGQHEV